MLILSNSLLYSFYDSEQAIWHPLIRKGTVHQISKKVSKNESNSIKEASSKNILTSTNCAFVLLFPFELIRKLTRDRDSMIGRQKLFNYRYPKELDCVLRIDKTDYTANVRAKWTVNIRYVYLCRFSYSFIQHKSFWETKNNSKRIS